MGAQMANDKLTDIETPAQKLKKLEDMTAQEIKDAIVQAVRRKARAEEDKKYYNKTYGEVIKEEAETIGELMSRLEFLIESDRRAGVLHNWKSAQQIEDEVDEIRDAKEQGDGKRVSAARGFLRAVGTEEADVDDADPNEE